MNPNDINAEKRKALIETLQAIIISLMITTVVYFFIAMPNQVISISMLPTFKEGELVITNKFINWFAGTEFGDNLNMTYDRGDVIVFQQPGDSDLIKRIIGVSGDKVQVMEGSVYLNDQLIEETYLDSRIETRGASFLNEGEEVTVPENSFFVMGDNRAKSLDSRYLDVGIVKREHIKGKVVWRYWPLDRFGSIDRGQINLLETPSQPI